MSYEFGMFFVPANTFGTALKKAQKFTEMLGSDENIEKIIENNKYYFPSVRYSSLADTEREKKLLGRSR